ncbi:hypothetical protein AYO46_10350 [Betaproteobacteria bacterium SCGC AG-212-J23]|nr:hypothetical protein AYO46_10350 [Betaproteobacteria bacterium SCGC AG-212-J23]
MRVLLKIAYFAALTIAFMVGGVFAFSAVALWMVLRGDVAPGQPIDPETLASTPEHAWPVVLAAGAITAIALLACWWIDRRLKKIG